jgi:phosphate:Na+ symporter
MDRVPGQVISARIDHRAATLCQRALEAAREVATSITTETALSPHAEPIAWSISPGVGAALADVERAARDLSRLTVDHRAMTLEDVANGTVTAADAFSRIEAVSRLERIAHHLWRSSAHLFARSDPFAMDQRIAASPDQK